MIILRSKGYHDKIQSLLLKFIAQYLTEFKLN